MKLVALFYWRVDHRPRRRRPWGRPPRAPPSRWPARRSRYSVRPVVRAHMPQRGPPVTRRRHERSRLGVMPLLDRRGAVRRGRPGAHQRGARRVAQCRPRHAERAVVLGVAAVAYCAIGFSLQGYPGRVAHALLAGGKPWDWAAPIHSFAAFPSTFPPASLAALFGMFAAGLAAVIPLGSGADRWRLGAACSSAALLAGLVFPLFAHWAWGGGWLAQLGVNYGLGGGFLDAGGSAAIQAVGGLAALSIAWILGPRRGKYNSEHMPVAIPGHNAVFVLFGCLLAWIGWSGLNSPAPCSSPDRRSARRWWWSTPCLRGLRVAGRRRHHAHALRQARRLALRQRLGGRPGRKQRRLRLRTSRPGHDRRPGRRRVSGLLGRVAGIPPRRGRPRRRRLRSRSRRHVGHPGRRLLQRGPGQWLAQFTGVATLSASFSRSSTPSTGCLTASPPSASRPRANARALISTNSAPGLSRVHVPQRRSVAEIAPHFVGVLGERLVSGHDLSRAEREQITKGFSPWC